MLVAVLSCHETTVDHTGPYAAFSEVPASPGLAGAAGLRAVVAFTCAGGVSATPAHRRARAHRRRVTVTNVQAGWEAWRRTLALRLDMCTAQRRADVQAAVCGVLSRLPGPLPSPSPGIYEPLPESERFELPDGAPALFGLCGRPRSGKDVVADYLQAHYRGVARMAFSDSIVEEVNGYLAGFAYELGGQTRVHRIAEANKSLAHYRHLLQAWGMARRDEDPHYWTRKVARTVVALRAGGARLVIATGVRMPTDVDVIAQLGGAVWRVVRPGNPYAAAHEVESGLDHLPDAAFVTVANPVEGELGPYEANVEAALRGRPQPFAAGTLAACPTRALAALAYLDGAQRACG
jgi:hypothetical protein